MKVKIYVEGGGNHCRELSRECRRGFSRFFENAGFRGCMPKVIACGSRSQAYDDFCTALKSARPGEFIVLLVDSEAHVTSQPWQHLRNRLDDKWERPANASDENVGLMVQCMETWFLADLDTLREFFQKGFNEGSLPAGNELEAIPKNDVLQGLVQATRQCGTRRMYAKGYRSYELLERIRPDSVCAKCPHAKSLITSIRNKCEQ